MTLAVTNLGPAACGASLKVLLAILISASLVTTLGPSFQSTASGTAASYTDVLNRVDGERIVSTISDLQNFNSRAYFFSSMLNASTYIRDRFAELGLWVTYQDFQVNGYPQRNVIAVLNGTNSSAPQHLFGAHYDSMTLALLDYQEGNSTYAPGADDDASGVAATIELATALHDMRFDCTLKFVAFGAEETGLNGSTAFVQKELEDGVLYGGTAIMDMIGYRSGDMNEVFILRGNSDNLMAKALQKATDDNDLDLSVSFVDGWEFGYSDHYPFWLAGYPSMLVIERLVDERPVNPYYHSENDTVDRLSQEQMTVVTKALLGCILELQNPQKEGLDYTLILVISAAVIVAIAIIVSLYVLRGRR